LVAILCPKASSTANLCVLCALCESTCVTVAGSLIGVTVAASLVGATVAAGLVFGDGSLGEMTS
jgi:hypothetical protein